MVYLSPRRYSVLLPALMLCMLGAVRASAQSLLCNCIAAWQQNLPAPSGCPLKDSTGRYDRSAKGYILFTGTESDAQVEIEKIVTNIKSCSGVAQSYQVHTGYDQVQMTNVYSFIPGSAAKTGDGNKQSFTPLKMELSLKSSPTASAILLSITGAAPIPGGEAAFINGTQALLKEWADASVSKAAFAGPKKGWASVYPAASYTGMTAATGRYGSGTVYRYEWHVEEGTPSGLQQSIVRLLKKIPSVLANASWYLEMEPGKSSTIGCRLLPPNPPITIETSYDNTEQAGIVRLSFIAPEAGTGK